MTTGVLYETDVYDLKRADRRKRTQRAAAHLVAELALIILLVHLTDIFGLIVYVVAVTTLLPSPFIDCPSKYQITNVGVVYGGGKVFSFRRDHKVTASKERQFVSIRRRWKGEVLRLYTGQPEEVSEVLSKAISNIGGGSGTK